MVSDAAHSRRLQAATDAARAAEQRGDNEAANQAWRRYRLVRDAGRDPDELLVEGIVLSRSAQRLLDGDSPE